MRRIAFVLLLLLAACSGRATPAPAPAADDEATVNQVLAGLDAVMGDLQRILVKERRMTPEVTDRLQAIYTGPELLNQIDAFRTDLANGLPGFRATPGNRVTTVARLITASPICMFVEVTRDYSPLADGPAPPPQSLYVILVAKRGADDPRGLNPTPWTMLYDGIQADGSQPDDVCR